MARYIKEFQNTENFDKIFQFAHTFLQSEGYRINNYNGEAVFQKGRGLMTAPSFVKLSCQNGVIRLEAWIKFALLPGVYLHEMDLDGFVGSVIKNALRGRVRQIECYIASFESVQQYVAPYIIASDTATSTEPVPPAIPVEPVQNNDSQIDDAERTSSAEYIFCIHCGTKIDMANDFCPACNHPKYDIKATELKQSWVKTMPIMNKQEYFAHGAPVHLIKDIRNVAIVCYILSAISFVIACIFNPFAILDVALLFGLTLGMHLSRSRTAAICLLVVSCIECIGGFILSGVFSGLLWIVMSILAVVFCSKLNRQYKAYLNERQISANSIHPNC